MPLPDASVDAAGITFDPNPIIMFVDSWICCPNKFAYLSHFISLFKWFQKSEIGL